MSKSISLKNASNSNLFSKDNPPNDGMLISIRKDVVFNDLDFTDIIKSLSQKNYEVGTKECRYDEITGSITIEGFGRLPSTMFHRIITASDFSIGQLVELDDSGQRLYITDIDYEMNLVELSFISPSDGLMNLLNSDGRFEHKTVVGSFAVGVIKEVEGNYSANNL